MKRLLFLLAALAMIAASCSGSSVKETSAPNTAGTDSPATTQQQEAPTTSAAETTTSTPVVEETPPPEGPPAKDFTLALEPDGEFVLSQEVKPVYMVFWAEW